MARNLARLANETYEFVNQMVLIERFEFFQGKSEDFLGRGTFGEVFRGRDTGNGKRVGIKRIPISTTAVRELSTLPTLRHPNLAAVFAIQQKGIYMYVVSEYCEYDLKRFLFLRGPFSDAEMRGVAAQLSGGLCALGELRHLNIKPTNVLVSAKDQTHFRLKLADFGLQRFLEAAYSSGFHGALVYMAPEMGAVAVLGKPWRWVGSRADVYSLGLVLHECATGALPYSEETALGLFVAAGNQEPASPRRSFRLSRLLSPELRDLLSGMLATSPSERLRPRAVGRHPFLGAAAPSDPDPEPRPPKRPHYCIVC